MSAACNDWSTALFDRSHRECVQADGDFGGRPHIRLRSSAVLILQRLILKEVTEGILSAVETLDSVMRLKCHDVALKHHSATRQR